MNSVTEQKALEMWANCWRQLGILFTVYLNNCNSSPKSKVLWVKKPCTKMWLSPWQPSIPSSCWPFPSADQVDVAMWETQAWCLWSCSPSLWADVEARWWCPGFAGHHKYCKRKKISEYMLSENTREKFQDEILDKNLRRWLCWNWTKHVKIIIAMIPNQFF